MVRAQDAKSDPHARHGLFPRHVSPDRLRQILRKARLGQVLIDARIARAPARVPHDMSRQSDDGDRTRHRIRLETPRHFPPIHAGHTEVEHDDVRTQTRGLAQALRTIGGGHRSPPAVREELAVQRLSSTSSPSRISGSFRDGFLGGTVPRRFISNGPGDSGDSQRECDGRCARRTRRRLGPRTTQSADADRHVEHKGTMIAKERELTESRASTQGA
jgi:hypothetical protein